MSEEKQRRLLERIMLGLPRPLSAAAYGLARATLLRDARMQFFRRVFTSLLENGVEGDYLEFGVYRGTSFVGAYKLAQQFGFNDMRFFAFDSFCGLPHGEGGLWGRGVYNCSQDRFLRILDKAGVDLNRVQTVAGFYEDSLTPETRAACAIGKAAIVHIDCDLYESTVQALDFIRDWIGMGTILVFDDWVHFGTDEYGEQRAFKEWSLAPCFERIPGVDGVRSAGFICSQQKPASLSARKSCRTMA